MPTFRNVAVGLGLAAALGESVGSDVIAGRSHGEQAAAVSRERMVRDRDIDFFENRIARDPGGALDRVRLGAMLLGRGRDTGNPADFVRAETEARTAIRNGSARNTGGWQLLVAATAAQHRFAEALRAADSLVRAADSTAGSRAIRGEMLVELGRYREADQVFGGLWPHRLEPGVGPRAARWADVRGRPWVAAGLLESLRTRALADEFGSVSGKAWYDYRLADLSLRYGRLGAARRYALRGLELDPDDPRLLGVVAAVAIRRGSTREAVDLAQRALAARPDPGLFALLAEVAFVERDSVGGFRYLDAARALAGLRGPGFHRGAALALVEHGVATDEVASAARQDVAARPDVYGWDLLAWSLFRTGHRREALQAIDRAQVWNSTDPSIERHARLIRGGV